MRAIKIGAASIVAGLFYITQYNRISLQNELLYHSMAFIHEQKPEFVLPILRLLINNHFLDRDQKLQKYLMASQFDLNGQCLEGLLDLGFAGAEVGPISFLAACKQQSSDSLGVLYTLARVYTFRENRRNSTFAIHLDLHPNYQIIKYTPYQIKENLLYAIKDILKTEDTAKVSAINAITLNFNGDNYRRLIGESSEEMQQMIIETVEEAAALIDAVKEDRHIRRMKLSLSINSNELKVVQYCKSHAKLIDRVILDGQPFEIRERQKINRKAFREQIKTVVELEPTLSNLLKWQDFRDYILRKRDL